MAVPLLTKKIVKKRVKQFKRPHLDRYKCLKVASPSSFHLWNVLCSLEPDLWSIVCRAAIFLSCLAIRLTHDVWIQYLCRGFVPYDYVRGLIVHRSVPLIFVIVIGHKRWFDRT